MKTQTIQVRPASLRQLQAETQEELNALLPTVLDKAFGPFCVF